MRLNEEQRYERERRKKICSQASLITVSTELTATETKICHYIERAYMGTISKKHKFIHYKQCVCVCKGRIVSLPLCV